MAQSPFSTFEMETLLLAEGGNLKAALYGALSVGLRFYTAAYPEFLR